MQYESHTLRHHEGVINVLDFQGAGPDVLFVHQPGLCALTWSAVIDQLRDRAHSYAVDLPGHGLTTTPITDALGNVAVVEQAVERLGLSRPVLVGADASTHPVLAYALAHPDRVAGVVTIGGFCLRDREDSAEYMAFIRSDEMHTQLVERFHLGETGRGAQEREEFIERLVAEAEGDWITSGLVPGYRAEIEYSTPMAADGTWVNTPSPEAAQAAYAVPDETDPYPDVSIYGRLGVPAWIVLTRDGPDADAIPAARHVSDECPAVTVTELDDGGASPQYAQAARLAGVVLEAAGTRAPR